MLPKTQYARAHGMMSLAESGSGIFAPLLAGALLGIIGLKGILLIDIVTFTFAIGTLLFVAIPKPPRTAEGDAGRGSLLRESLYGFTYIFARPSLLGLQLVFLVGNTFTSIAFTTLAALILARTNHNELIFGTTQAAGAIGGLLGGLLMSAWGGPKRLVHGVLLGWAISGFSMVLIGLGRGLPLWAAGLFLGGVLIPIMNGSNQAIWQAKVAPDVQGRVFSIRRLIAWVTNPIGILAAIPLADRLLGPAMLEGGSLVPVFGWLVGTGPGAGISLIFIFTGVIGMLVGLTGYLIPAVRNVEKILPDHVATGEHLPVAADAESAVPVI